MEMFYSYVLMYRKLKRKIVFLWLMSLSVFAGTSLLAQLDKHLPESARSILEERGELVFEFYPEDLSDLENLNRFLSIDQKIPGGFVAYANEKGFRSFLEYDIDYKLIHPHPLKKSQLVSDVFPGNWDVYPSSVQYHRFMDSISMLYPEICRLDTIGQSVEGREILVMKITNKPDRRLPRSCTMQNRM
jgi:hypothetical protein